MLHASSWLLNEAKSLDMYIHFWKCINMYVHGIDMYIHLEVYTCMYIVRTFMYMYIQVSTYFEPYKHVHTMYIPCTYLYIHICYIFLLQWHTCMSRYVQLMFSVQMATYISWNVQHHWTVYVHWCILLVSAFVLPSWLACTSKQGLAATRCHANSSSSTLV